MTRFKIKVNIGEQCMYWTLNGSTIDSEKAYVFTEQSVPDMFKSSLSASYVELEYVE